MDPGFTHENMPQLLLKARERMLRHFRPIITSVGLTEQQWRILRTLHERGQLEPRELCDVCQIQSSSMAGVLTRMEEKELITRSPVPGDLRRVWVSMTPRGQRIVHHIAPLIEAQYEHLKDALGHGLIGEIYERLNTLIERENSVTVHAVPLNDLPKTDALY